MAWLDKQIGKLDKTKSQFNEEISIVLNTCPSICNEFQEATPLKLILLNWALSIYAPIIKKHFDKMFYIDLFAGSGVNKMKSRKDYLIGSPFISILPHRGQFNKFFFCETDPAYCSALNQRLSLIQDVKFEICPVDYQKVLDKVLEEIRRESGRSHIFFFI